MTKELEALKRIRQETCPATYMADFDKNECCDVIEQALQRLEAIDNATPSEALKCLEQFINEMTYCLEHPKEYAKGYERQIFWKYKNTLETTIKQALQRLEAIENAEPSEALECLEHIKKDDFNMIITTYPPLPAYNGITKDEMFNKIEQALLKAQELEKENQELLQAVALFKQKLEDTDNIKVATTMMKQLDKIVSLEKENKALKAQEPKHYLKWEDLEKFEEQKDFFALLNGNKYTLWRYRDSRNNYVMVNLNEINIATLCDMFKQDIDFFNDLHLERVEE